MLNLFNVISNVFMTVNIYDENANQGNTIWPFVSFMMFTAGIILVFIGVIKLSTAKREWSLFYDRRDSLPEAKEISEKKAKKHALILIALGVVIFIASFFVK